MTVSAAASNVDRAQSFLCIHCGGVLFLPVLRASTIRRSSESNRLETQKQTEMEREKSAVQAIFAGEFTKRKWSTRFSSRVGQQ
jgi:hypothetical protein